MENNNQEKHVTQKLFTELFRPQNLGQAVLVPRVREELEKGLQDHILMYGKQGTGKSLGYNEEIKILVSNDLYDKIQKFLKNV